MNLADHVTRFAHETPDAVALAVEGYAQTYRELERRVTVSAGALAAKGLGEGAVVAIRIGDSLVHVAVSLALARLGVAQIGLPADGVNESDLTAVQRAGATAMVTDSPDRRMLGPAPIAFEHAWLEADDPPVAPYRCSGDGGLVCLIGTSSGTTGEPKIFAVTNRQMIARADHAGAIGYGAGDRFLSLLGVSVFMQKSLVWRVLMGGGTVLFPPSIDPDAIAAFCERHGVTHIYAFPFMVDPVTPAKPALERYRDLACFAMAGATVTEEMTARIRERITDNVFVAYGTNEVGTVAYADPATRRQYPDAVGRAMPGVEWQIVDDAGAPVAAGEVGLLRVRTPGMIDGYIGAPALDAHHFMDGWFYPRDLLSATDEGILRFHGRADDMMIVDGLNVYPAQIESVLRRHPAVADAAAFALKSSVHQDLPAAAVILERAATVGELQEFCRIRLGARTPLAIFIVEDFPRSATGKVLKAKLAETAESAVQPPGAVA
jgi:acyl-coenzyme A synthetase/AMP-(fatty) acid ligase